DLAGSALRSDPLDMVVDRDGESAFRALLADDVLIEPRADVLWLRWLGPRGRRRPAVIAEELPANRDAPITNIGRGASNQLPDLAAGASTEGTAAVDLSVLASITDHISYRSNARATNPGCGLG